MKETRPGGEETRYHYDAAGNLTVRQDSLGQERRYAYDNLRRRVREEHYPKLNGQLATEPSRVIVYSYDAKGQLLGYTDTPKEGQASGASYALDALGRKTTEEINFGPFQKTLATSYRANGQKATLTYPNGHSLGVSYDTGGQVQSITSPGGQISFQYQHGQPTRVNLPGATRSLEYDPLQRLTRILLERGEAGSGNTLLDTRYTYDAVSDITTRQSLEGEYPYQYDPLSRLTTVTPPEALQRSEANPAGLPLEGYQYDGVHNRIASSHQPGPWVYNANHQLLSHGLGDEAVSREYDANGHTRSIGQGALQKRLAYDVAERLVSVESDTGTPIGRYEYDPFGRRQKKTTGTDTIYFQYSDQGLIAEFDATGNPQATYGWQPEGMWGTNPLWKKEGSNTYFYSNDHLGTPQLLTDTAGQVVWKAKAEAFGKTTVDASSSITNNLRFPGQYFDAETGWHYNYFRDYEPSIGRYVQSDPMGLEGGTNRFVYALGEPGRRSDPTGLKCTCKETRRPVYGLPSGQEVHFECEERWNDCPAVCKVRATCFEPIGKKVWLSDGGVGSPGYDGYCSLYSSLGASKEVSTTECYYFSRSCT